MEKRWKIILDEKTLPDSPEPASEFRLPAGCGIGVLCAQFVLWFGPEPEDCRTYSALLGLSG